MKNNITVSFVSWFINEPKLIFGEGEQHIDIKTGLITYGPCLLSEQNTPMPSLIRVGIIGTSDTINLTERWIEKCKSGIQGSSEDPVLRPSFPGVSRVFGSKIMLLDQWKEIITQQEVNRVITIRRFHDRVKNGAKLFSDHLRNLAEREPRPDVVICALPWDIVDSCGTLGGRGQQERRVKLTPAERELLRIIKRHRETGQTTLFPLDELSLDIDLLPGTSDFRGILKAEAMSIGLPTQIAWPSTFTGEQHGNIMVQDEATRAWNFCVALYYKAGGFPWRIADASPGTCYIGISFYKDQTDISGQMRTSIAQIFTHTGEGLVLRGSRFVWSDSRHKKSPHLDEEGAFRLLKDAIELYQRHMHQSPSRLVVHKSSRYWPDELRGFRSATEGIHQVDFVAILVGGRGIRFMRKGAYPPLRGTVIQLADRNYLLYSKGYVPYLQTYPGLRVPRPLEIIEHIGDSTPNIICKEILTLTKMNWNSADFSSGEPITLAFSRHVGEILAQLPDDVIPQSQYRFYM
jgi:hypothetical protein